MNRLRFILRYSIITLSCSFVSALATAAEDRETKVRSDQSKIEEAGNWIYNDLEQGFKVAKETGKPLLVVMRCVPCEACAQLDEQVVKRDRVLQSIMDQFVCVRIIATNGMDLNLLQYDYDQSWAALMMNADKTIYGRYGTRTHQTRSEEDISVEGFADSLKYALQWHKEYQSKPEMFAAKRGPEALVAKPELYPNLSGKYTDKLDYKGKVVQSCIHCHQVGEAARLTYRSQGKPIPEQLLYPHPNPKIFGMIMDPRKASSLRRVVDGSVADKLGLKRGDRVAVLDGQPILSTADIQWVLHHTTKKSLPMKVERDGKEIDVTLDLPSGWRRLDDITWRVSSWDLCRMVTGGLRFETPDEKVLKANNLTSDQLALSVKHVGQYGDHAVAKKAGFQVGDILVEINGVNQKMSEGDLLTHLAQSTKPGQKVATKVVRNGKEIELTLLMQ